MTPKEEATRLHALLVRNRLDGDCEARVAHRNGKIDWHRDCRGASDCSHIVPRGYSNTRTELDNGIALCREAHEYVGTHKVAHMELVEAVYGPGHWAELWVRAALTPAKVDWVERVEVLTRLAKMKGLVW